MRFKELEPMISQSAWIWPEGELYLTNCHAQFRHDFVLNEIPAEAPLFITADQSYRLYINGCYVCRGPARGYQSSWPCDEIDVARYLRCGHNIIAAEAYNPGIGTFQYLHCSAAGFFCAAEWNGVSIHTSKKNWIMRRSPANNPNIARLSRQMGFQEDFNANADDLSWIDSEIPPEWTESPMYRWSGEVIFGKGPWYSLETRVIPMLREDEFAPERLTVCGTAPMAEGWQNCFNIAWHWQLHEYEKIRNWVSADALNWSQRENTLRFHVAPQEKENCLSVVLDLGSIEFGTLTLKVSGGSGNEIIDCIYHQYLADGVPGHLMPVGSGGQLALATRLRVASGVCKREFFQTMGARYVILVFRNVTTALEVDASYRKAEYPFSMRGEFDTSDCELDAIYKLCHHTQQICASDSYLDTPWREQGQWWGDARIQGRNTFYLDGDPRLLKRGIRSIAGQQAPFGLTYGVAPCCNSDCILPDFSLTWILTIYDLWFQTGELELFWEQHDRISSIFNYFESMRKENGPVCADKRFWLFEDWAALPKHGYPAFLNLWLLYTRQHYQKLLEAAGLQKEAEYNRQWISCMKDLLERQFFDSRQQLFITGLDADGKPFDNAPSLHDQVLAILTGLVPEAYPQMVQKRLLPFLQNESCDFAVPSSFWCSYLLDAAKIMGLEKEALKFIRFGWGRMISSGGTWEHFVWDVDDGQSCCHAWSSHPAVHLIDLLLGLSQTEPRWRVAACSPHFELLPDSGRILLPLPPGDLIAEWDRQVFSITVPAGMKLHLSGEERSQGTYRFPRPETATI